MCEAALASLRFRAAISWAHDADHHHQPALDAYEAAIELLPRLAMLGLDLQSRQQALTMGSDGLAHDAAAMQLHQDSMKRQWSYLKQAVPYFGHRP